MNKLIITLAVAALALGAFAQKRGEATERGRRQRRGRAEERGGMQANPEAKLHRFSTTIEKERPQLNQETKDLIAAYRRNPSDENRAALRRQVAKNYDVIVARKKAKLEELKRTARRLRLEAYRVPHKGALRIAQGQFRLSECHIPRRS